MTDIPPKILVSGEVFENPLKKELGPRSSRNLMAQAASYALTLDPPPGGKKLRSKDLDTSFMYGQGLKRNQVTPSEILALWDLMDQYTTKDLETCIRGFDDYPPRFPANKGIRKEGLGTKSAQPGGIPYGPSTFYWNVAVGLGSRIPDFTEYLAACLMSIPGSSTKRVMKPKPYEEAPPTAEEILGEELQQAWMETQNARMNLNNCMNELPISKDEKKNIQVCLKNYERTVLSLQARQLRALFDSLCKMKRDNLKETIVEQLMNLIPGEHTQTQLKGYRKELEDMFSANYPNLPGFMMLAFNAPFMRQ